MKRLWIMTLILALLFNVSALAQEVTVDGINYVLHEDYTATITKSEVERDHLRIPSEIHMDSGIYAVTAIGEFAFWETGISSVEIAEGIRTIGESAFQDCYRLRQVKLPQSLERLESSAFYQCYSLEDIVLPDGLKYIGDCAFLFCAKLKDINLPDKLECLEGYALAETMVERIRIPSGITVLPNGLLSGCWRLHTVDIPQGATELGENVFQDCYNLRNITLPESMETIGNDAIDGCYGINAIFVPESWDEQKIEEMGLPHEVVIYGMQNIAEIDGIVYHLKGNTATILDYKEGLTKAEIPVEIQVSGVRYRVDRIMRSAFAFCESLQEAVIAEGITEIPDAAFNNCINLQRVELPDGVVSIGMDAFFCCEKLVDIRMPDTVKVIDECGFWGCTSLVELYISQSLEWTGNAVFKYCESLKEIALPDSVRTINNELFAECTSLERVVLPENPEFIASGIFRNCKMLEHIVLPVGFSKIGEGLTGDRIFEGCINLKTVEMCGMPEHGLSQSEFEGCESLEAIILPQAWDDEFISETSKKLRDKLVVKGM